MSVSKSKQKLSDRYSSRPGGSGASNAKPKAMISKSMVIIALCLVAVIGGVVAAAVLLGGKGKDAIDPTAYNLVVTPDNIDELLADGNIKKAEKGTYDVCMNSEWVFPDAESPSSNAYVENVITNNNTAKFTIERDDTGSTIYESPYIPVGSSIKNIKLSDESMSKGRYGCTVVYHLVDDDYNEISTVRVSVNIIIRN